MEQDRTSPVQLHHAKLAWQAFGESPSHRQLDRHTTTRTGLVVKAALDTNHYDTKIKVSDEELSKLRLKRHEFHGDWNYTISPRH